MFSWLTKLMWINRLFDLEKEIIHIMEEKSFQKGG